MQVNSSLITKKEKGVKKRSRSWLLGISVSGTLKQLYTSYNRWFLYWFQKKTRRGTIDYGISKMVSMFISK